MQGVEFDPLGDRVAYWLFPEHPGAALSISGTLLSPSRRVPAEDVEHIFDCERAGQVRAVSWFAPLILPAKDLDEYIDAQLVKQKIAACLAVIMSDTEGLGAGLGATDDSTNPGIDTLSPGAVLNVGTGKTIEVVRPPSVGDYEPFTRSEHRRHAKGLGLSYEDYSGDYSNVNFSSARMARLEHWDNVYDWRWRLLIPQFCDRTFRWAIEAMQVQGLVPGDVRPEWTAPPMAMIEPDKEGLAILRNARAGIQTIPDAMRERGYDPDAMLKEIAEFNAKMDALNIRLDSDPRYMTQAGQLQGDPLVGDGGAA
jgi:lambda family phage portal protein